MKKLFLLSVAGAVLGLLAGCSSPGNQGRAHAGFSDFTGSNAVPASMTVVQTNALNPALLRPSTNMFTLGPGDRIDLEILGTKDSRTLTTVGPDGKIYYYLLPGLDVWGLTLEQTRQLLEQELAKYITEPTVTVTLREVASKRIWVLGRLNKPGLYPITGPITVLESLALAGGTARSSSQVTTEELADLRHSFVMRNGQFLPVDFYRLMREGDASQNIYLEPDDFIYIPSALSQQVYVLGAVKTPHSVPYTERMTLVSAITAAAGAARIDWLSPTYGLAADAYLSHVAIVRGSLAEPQMSVVDLGAIIHGRAPDVMLEPGDIIYVPNSPLSTFKRYFNAIVNTFVSTVAANEGTRAGGGSVAGVAIPVGQ